MDKRGKREGKVFFRIDYASKAREIEREREGSWPEQTHFGTGLGGERERNFPLGGKT